MALQFILRGKKLLKNIMLQDSKSWKKFFNYSIATSNNCLQNVTYTKNSFIPLIWGKGELFTKKREEKRFLAHTFDPT